MHRRRAEAKYKFGASSRTRHVRTIFDAASLASSPLLLTGAVMRIVLCSVLLAGAGWSLAGDWPKYGRNLSNHRYSPVAQIDRQNVAQLELAWRYETGKKATFQTSPIVVDGVMYLMSSRIKALPFLRYG